MTATLRRRALCAGAWCGVVSVAVLLGVACGARTGLGVLEPDADAGPDASVRRDAGRDAARDAPDAEPDVVVAPLCNPNAGPVGANACTRTLKVVSITKSMPSCFVDLVAQPGDNGTLLYDCTPKGNARVIFADPRVFIGTFDGTGVDVCTGTVFPWSDGCTWRSSQRIMGDPKSGTLSFTYTEEPAQGTGCEPPCTATGVISVGP
jgi:hypothetical protein